MDSGSRGQLVDDVSPSAPVAVRDRSLDSSIRRPPGEGRPAVPVAADPGRFRQPTQRRHRLQRPRPEQRVVPPEHDPLGPGRASSSTASARRGSRACRRSQRRRHMLGTSNTIDAVEVVGPDLMLRFATAADAPALLALGSDPEVTQFFSWGPYSALEEPAAYIARPGRGARARGAARPPARRPRCRADRRHRTHRAQPP